MNIGIGNQYREDTLLWVLLVIFIGIAYSADDYDYDLSVVRNELSKAPSLPLIKIKTAPDTKLSVIYQNSSFLHYEGKKSNLHLTCFSTFPIAWIFDHVSLICKFE